MTIFTEKQQEVFNFCCPLWRKSAVHHRRHRFLSQIRFRLYLTKVIGVGESKPIEFEQLTDEQCDVILEHCKRFYK